MPSLVRERAKSPSARLIAGSRPSASTLKMPELSAVMVRNKQLICLREGTTLDITR